MHDKYLYIYLICVGMTKDIYQIVRWLKRSNTKKKYLSIKIYYKDSPNQMKIMHVSQNQDKKWREFKKINILLLSWPWCPNIEFISIDLTQCVSI